MTLCSCEAVLTVIMHHNEGFVCICQVLFSGCNECLQVETPALSLINIPEHHRHATGQNTQNIPGSNILYTQLTESQQLQLLMGNSFANLNY